MGRGSVELVERVGTSLGLYIILPLAARISLKKTSGESWNV
jgi:hypothetical protein